MGSSNNDDKQGDKWPIEALLNEGVSESGAEHGRAGEEAGTVLGASGVAHDNLRDSSRESSDRFEPSSGVIPPGASEALVAGRPGAEPAKAPSSNGWMNRSRLRPYFNISLVGDAKVASCVYCGKEYKEGESTGNLSKHITNNHAVEYKSRERAVSKETTLTSLTSQGRSLRLSSRFVSELTRESGTFASVVLITETLVPFYVVESMGWKIINGLVPDVPLIETRKSVVEKLEHYSKSLNQSLRDGLEASTFVSVQLYVCSRENELRYLAVSVSFAPNILDEERLGNMQGYELLLNNTGDPVNGHLLDVVEFNEQSHDSSFLCQGVLKILDDYRITQKVATVTIDQFSYALGLHDALVGELLSHSHSEVMRYLGNVRLSRCINSGLELQFECVANDLIQDGDFQHEYKKIEKLAQSWDRIPFLKNFADELVRPPFMSSQHNQARVVWRQITRFLQVQQRLKEWLENANHQEEASTVQFLGENIYHTSRALEMFRFFVDCCAVFDKLRGTMLTDGICYLPEGIYIYYRLNRFFIQCERASRGEHVDDEDFAYLNGSKRLLPEHKQRVLKAVMSSRQMFDGFFEGVKNNSLFYVAAALDPSCRLEGSYNLTTPEEHNMLLCQIEVTVQDYLARCNSTEYEHENDAVQSTTKRRKLAEEAQGMRPQNEWARFKTEAKLPSRLRRDVIQWWYDHRNKYPHLFRLAMALYYTQISSNETENIFYVTEHTLKVYQRSVGRANTQKVMLLRNRFKNFGLYNQALRFVNPILD